MIKWKYKLRLKGITPEQIRRTQMFIDSEILRNSDPFVPLKTGMLKRSGITGTRMGTGIIKYTAPYSKKQYFYGRAKGQRGRKWTRRMWTSQGKKILKNAKKMINRGR